MKVLAALLALAATASANNWSPYIGHQTLSVTPVTTVQLAYLNNVQETNLEVEFYHKAGRVDRAVDVRVPPSQRDAFTADLTAHGIEFTVKTQDLGESLRQNWEVIMERQAASANFDYNNFNNLTQILDEVNNLANQCIDGFTCTVEDIGNSIEGRPLRLVRVSSNKGNPVVWLEATTHAREWLATATMMKLMQQMFTQYGTDADTTALLNNYDWYLLPVVNPDGYEFSWTDDRMWRKNRRDNAGFNCMGVDINRNYLQLWGEPGASALPCATDYRGASAGSEPETQAVMNRMTAASDNGEVIVGMWSIHAYGEYILLPYGDGSYTTDWNDLLANGAAVCNAIEATYNNNWDCGNVREVLYQTSGNTNDWAKAYLNVKYPYIPEVRGTDFIVSPALIEPSFQEMWNGLVAFVNNF